MAAKKIEVRLNINLTTDFGIVSLDSAMLLLEMLPMFQPTVGQPTLLMTP